MSRTRVAAVCFAAGLLAGAFRAWPVAAQAPAPPPYLDPDLDFEARARDLVSRMTVEEKVSQLTNQAAAIPRLGVPAYEWWNECLHGVARAGVATVFPQAIGLAATFDEPLIHEMAEVIADEARAKHHQFVPPGQARPLPGPHLLVAQHQHLPRPALGAGAGDVRRGPVPHRPPGRRLREGPAGRRPALLQGHRHRQALRRPQRPGAGPPPLRRPPQRARPPRDLPARVPRPRAGSEGGVRHGRLQPRQRRVGLGQPAPAAGHPAQGVGLRRLRGLGLRGHRRHLHAPQAGGDGGRGVGARGHEGLRPRVREHLPHPRKGPRARPSPGGGPGRGGPPAHARADEARDVRSAGAGGATRGSRTPSTTRRSTTASRGGWPRSRSSS